MENLGNAMFVSGKMSRKSGSSSQKIYTVGHVLPILTEKVLYESPRHQALLRQLRELLFMPEEDFERFYQPVLTQFSEFVQVIPSQIDLPLSSLFNEGFARGVLAVKRYLADGAKADPLLLYAIFTAGIFRDVAKVIINHKVIMTTEKGDFLHEWVPFKGSMVGKTDFYKLFPLAPIYQRLETSLTPLLAKQLMPTEGFLWIVSDLKIYADWLDALRGDDGQGGGISRTLSLMKREDIYSLINTLPQVTAETTVAENSQYGDMFYNWLREGIAKGDIKVNTADSGVHMVSDGLFLERNKIFHHFAEASKLNVNMNVVFAQFGNLFAIAQKGGGDFMHRQFFSEYPMTTNDKGMAFSSPLASRQRSLRAGMVLGDPAVLFVNAQMPAATDMLKAMQPKTPASHQVPSQAQTPSSTPAPKK